MDEARVDPDALTRDLRALLQEPRARLLAQLGAPRTLPQLKLLTSLPESELQTHLDGMLLAGLVRKGRQQGEYVAAAGRLHAMGEDLQRLAAAPDEDALTETRAGLRTSRGASAILRLGGPTLLAVHGVKQGTVFRLSGSGPWTIGRDADRTVSVEDDGFLSGRHAQIAMRGKTPTLVDDVSRNGTFLNWDKLPKGGEAALVPGDVIGAGKSLFVYRA